MNGTQVLVVEDENIVAKDIEERLKTLGYEVPAIASCGEEAVEKAASTQSDLVLMDIRLRGEMDGVSAAERIRQTLNIPVVYLTAYADDETLRRAKVTEPYGYILKPFEERELRTTIEIALYKHKMESKVRESEQWLSTTLRSIADAVIATDTKGVVTFINPVAESLTGWRVSQARGEPLTAVFNIIHEETRTHLEDLASQVLREGMPMNSREDHIVLIARDGTEIPIDDCAAAIKDDQGEVAGVVLVFRDITERRLAERILRQHAEYLRKRIKELNCFYTIFRILRKSGAALDEVFQRIVDTTSFAWQYPNETCVRILLNGREYKTENFRETVWKQQSEVRAAGEHVGTLEVCYLEEKPESYEGPFLKEERSLLNAIAVFLGHVVEHEQARRALDRAQAELSRYSDDMGQLVQSASHELRDVLGAIEADLNGSSVATRAESSSDARSHIRHAQSMVDELFAYLGVCASRKAFERIDCQRMLDETVAEFREHTETSDVTVTYADLPTITANPAQVRILFRSLLDYALASRGEKSPEVRIEAERKEGKWLFSVSDNGIGCDSDHAKQLFGIRPRPTRDHTSGDAGIGLAICRKIVDHHGGDIWAEPRPGGGTICRFSLPNP